MPENSIAPEPRIRKNDLVHLQSSVCNGNTSAKAAGASLSASERTGAISILPKTKSSRRVVAIPSRTAALLAEWLIAIEDDPEAWVFLSENRRTPMWRDNVWYRGMRPRLKPVGLDWANFQVMRRTHATLGHELGIDPKISAD